MIVGVQKAGTSSLLGYLAQHPEILVHETTELDFFVNDEAFENLRIAEYFSRTPDLGEVALAKSATVMHTPIALSRLHEHNPDCKIIIVLRNPTDRAHSSFWWARSNGLEDLRTFEDAIWKGIDRFSDARTKRNCDYLATGLYAKWINEIYRKFTRDQVSILLLEDLRESLERICCELLHFIGVDPDFEIDATRVLNPASEPRSRLVQRIIRSRTSTKSVFAALLPKKIRKALGKRIEGINTKRMSARPIASETRKKLLEYYSAPNRELEELIGRRLEHWDI
jgi:hypothetical protein